jgi:hypothetical protein
MNKHLLVLPLLFSVCALASAKDWYVAPNGDDANNGSSLKTAFQTFLKANSVVEPGDVVLVADGVYTSDPKTDKNEGSALLNASKSGTADAWITWKPVPGHKPVLRSKAWGAIRITSSYIVIDGFNVLGYNEEIPLSDAQASEKKPGNDPYYNTNGIVVEGRKLPPDQKPHHIIVRNCIVSNMPGGGITGLETDYLTVEDNKVFNNAWYMKYGGSGITTLDNWQFDDKPGYHIIIQRNYVWNNKTMVPWSKIGKLSDGNGILLDVTEPPRVNGANNPTGDATVKVDNPTNPNGDPVVKAEPKVEKPVRPLWTARALIANNISAFNGGSGIHVFRTRNVDIVNNITYKNGGVVGYEELFSNNSSDVVILNNIIVPRRGGKVTSNNKNTNVRWDYNMYPIEQSVMKGEHDIVADPKFIDAYIDLARANFQLAKDSPAIGAGTTELFQALDIDGKKRTPNKAPNLGAYK